MSSNKIIVDVLCVFQFVFWFSGVIATCSEYSRQKNSDICLISVIGFVMSFVTLAFIMDTNGEGSKIEKNNKIKKNKQHMVSITLEPYAKCVPLITSAEMPEYDCGTIIFPLKTNVSLCPGFAFTLQNEMKFVLGEMGVEYGEDPNAVLVKKKTPYYSSNKTDEFSCKTKSKEYCYLELGSVIVLPEGTVFNDGIYEMKFTKNTTVKVG